MPVDHCPCCGQTIRDAPLKVSLEFNTVICGERALAMTPKQTEVVYVLQKAWPSVLPHGRLVSQVWGAANAGAGTVRNTVYTARKKLKAVGYIIKAAGKRGYRLEKIRP